MNVVRFTFFAILKIMGYAVFPSKLSWLSRPPKDWNKVSLILILNHTSLFEFVYGVALDYRFLWALSRRLVIPVAESTLIKPIWGSILKVLAPKTVSISRRRDQSWLRFLDLIEGDDICIFMPEGEMKRKTGLNKNGDPMTVKHGVYDVLKKFQGKNMVVVYSKGLHHIMAPGDKWPKIFKRVEAKLEYFEVNRYLDGFEGCDRPDLEIARDLEQRRDLYC